MCPAPASPSEVGPRDTASFHRSRCAYEAVSGETLREEDDHPCLGDATGVTFFDPHYTYQSRWAAERVVAGGAGVHADAGSEAVFLAVLSAVVPVWSFDIRPLPLGVDRFTGLSADLLRLPLPDASLPSVSSLHVVEHVGLGRYGDRLNPAGTRAAVVELGRVTRAGGLLLLSVPVGRARTCFNAHRVLDPDAVPGWLPGFTLEAFSLVDDGGVYHPATTPTAAAGSRYACGMYALRRSG